MLGLDVQVQYPAITQGGLMGKQPSHLSSEERAVLHIERGNGASIRSIARRLGRSASTLAREMAWQHGSVYAARKAAIEATSGKVYRYDPKTGILTEY